MTYTSTICASAEEYIFSIEVEYFMQGASVRITDACTDRIYESLKRDREDYILPMRVSDFFRLLEDNLQSQHDALHNNEAHNEVISTQKPCPVVLYDTYGGYETYAEWAAAQSKGGVASAYTSARERDGL